MTSEFFETYEEVLKSSDIHYDPVVETVEEYGYDEPSTDVPPPDDSVENQNPGFVNGDHT